MTCVLSRRIPPKNWRPQSLHLYCCFLPLRPFLTTFTDPQKKHFFNHISNNLCKDIKINALQRFYPTFCRLSPENRWLIIIYIQTSRTMRHVESDLYAWPFQEPPPRLHERPFPRNMPRTGFWSRSLTLKLLPFRLTGARPHATSGPAMLPGTCCPSKQISSLNDTPSAYSRLPS